MTVGLCVILTVQKRRKGFFNDIACSPKKFCIPMHENVQELYTINNRKQKKVFWDTHKIIKNILEKEEKERHLTSLVK